MTQRSRSAAAENDVESRQEPEFELTNEQWDLISDLFASPPPSPVGGRPRASARCCFEAIAWVLRSGARWKDLPSRFPSYVTCWRRFKAWTESGLFRNAWARLVNKLDRQRRIEREESIADGTFSPAKKGAFA